MLVDEELIESLFEAQAQFKKNPGEGAKDSKNDIDLLLSDSQDNSGIFIWQ